MDRDELKALLTQAGEEGATRALERVGLHDERAGDDVRGLRDLLRSYRTVKGSMLSTLGKILMTAVLLGLAYKAGLQGWLAGVIKP